MEERLPDYHQPLLALLQQQAPTIMKIPPGTPFVAYWTRLVLGADVDLWRKAGIDRDAEKRFAELTPLQQQRLCNVSDDLTYAELLQIFVYLNDQHTALMRRWSQRIDSVVNGIDRKDSLYV